MAEVEKDKGIGVDKPDTIGDVEKFKGYHRELNLYRIHFLSFVSKNLSECPCSR